MGYRDQLCFGGAHTLQVSLVAFGTANGWSLAELDRWSSDRGAFVYTASGLDEGGALRQVELLTGLTVGCIGLNHKHLFWIGRVLLL